MKASSPKRAFILRTLLRCGLISEGLRRVDDLTQIASGLADEAAEYLVGKRVAALWDKLSNEEDVGEGLAGDGGYYFNLIRSRFEAEREEVDNLPTPDDWSFRDDGGGSILPPKPMQRRTAWQVMTKKRVGNWSGPGAGKTNSALLASRVADCRNTLIVVANATVDGWVRAIENTFPNSVIHTAPAEPAEGEFNYTIINYEKFQQANRGNLARRLIELSYDFVVLDEVQFTKQRDGLKSLRRETLEAVVHKLGEANPDLRVLGMSATPVINNLYEARKLLEIINGRSFGDLDSRPTVANALAVHRALITYGFRYKPPYPVEFGKPTPVPVDGNHLLEDLQSARGVLGVEQVLLPAKLAAIKDHIRPGTIIYSHYVDGMVYPTRRFVEALDTRWRVGVYTGQEKDGLDAFREERVDVLIGSAPVATGVNGLQRVSNQIIILSLPWTGAGYEQLLGRVRRPGSKFSEISIVLPQVFLEHNGNRWSWDERRQAVVEYKRTLSDCAVDGNIPETLSISPTLLLKSAREALEDWIARVESDGLELTERPKLEVPLPPELRKKARVKHGSWREINREWSAHNSATTHERLQKDPLEWFQYHTEYSEARRGWDEIPAERLAEHLRGRPDLKIGDFGCGECLLKAALPDHEVIGFDHVAVDETVTVCDIARVPLEDASLGAAVFSLSLMDRNWPEYLEEANRVLQTLGWLLVAEPAKKWDAGKLEAAIEAVGFKVVESYPRTDFRYALAVKT